MKLNLEHFGLQRANDARAAVADSLERLGDRIRIDEANVRVAQHRESSPPYRVRFHLVTPGPDIFAQASDHTLAAAISKAVQLLDGKISSRGEKRQRRETSGPARPAIKVSGAWRR